MKNIFSFFSSENLSHSLRMVCSRFLQAVILIGMVSSILFYMVATEPTNPIFMKLAITGVITFFLSLCTALFLETRRSSSFDVRFPIFPIVYGILFYLTLRISHTVSVEGIVYSLLHLIGFIAGVFFAPYIMSLFDGKVESIGYVNYFSRIAWVLLMSTIVGLAVLLLGYIALASVSALFDLSLWISNGKIYGYWAVISLALIAPIYGLIHIPIASDISSKKYETNRFFAFLVKYVFIPAILIYFLILYVYSMKVLMNFSDWPKGMISWMVIGFSSFGYLTYIFSRPYDDTLLVGVFRRYFPYVVIPQIAMLGYAIYLRLSQYDLTMNRYFVVIFGLWLLGISLYLIVRARKSLVSIVASLAVLSLIISIGPWSVFSLPFHRQEMRLIRNLEAANILQGETIVPLKDFNDISRELSGDISSGIQFLCEIDDCSLIKRIFSRELEGVKESYPIEGKDATELSSWTIISTLQQKLKVGYYTEEPFIYHQSWYMARDNDEYSIFPLSVTGYDEVIKVYATGSYNGNTISYISVDSDMKKATLLSASGDTMDIFPLDSIHAALDGKGNHLSSEEMTFDVTGEKYSVRFMFSSYAIRNRSSDDNSLSISGYALIKRK